MVPTFCQHTGALCYVGCTNDAIFLRRTGVIKKPYDCMLELKIIYLSQMFFLDSTTTITILHSIHMLLKLTLFLKNGCITIF